jgi:hypothetical protein
MRDFNARLAAGITVTVAIAAIIASPVLSALAAPAYTTVTSSSVTSNPAGKKYVFSATTGGAIPHTPDSYTSTKLVFGYAWLDAFPLVTPTNGVLAVIHPGVVDSTQNPNGWHAHTATLNAAGCVTGVADINAGVGINGNTVKINMRASEATVTPTTFVAAAAFELVVDAATCPAPLPGLKVVTPPT